MTKTRLLQIIKLNLQRGAVARGDWLRKKGVFSKMGHNVRYQIRGIPLYPELISIGSNINLSSGVQLITHDAIHLVYNELSKDEDELPEKVECIEIKDNVFIGANCVILGGVRIGPNAIVSANTLVNRDLEPGGIYGGVPAKRIGDFYDLWESRKRRDYPAVEENQFISDEEIENAWNYFNEMHEEGKI